MVKVIKNIIFNMAIALVSLLVIVIFYKNIILTALLLLIIAIIGLFKWKSKTSIFIFIFMIFFGGFVDIAGVNFGVWSYAEADFFNVPSWLFIGWGIVGIFVYQMALELNKLVKK